MYRINLCPCCDSRDLSIWPAMLSPFISEYAVKNSSNLVDLAHCSNCGFKFFLDRYEDKEVFALYSNYRGYKYCDARHRHEFWYTHSFNESIGNSNEIRQRKECLFQFLKNNNIIFRVSSVLDWGGDRGQYIPDIIPERYVYEISDVNPVSGVTKLANKQDVLNHKFDMVMLCHVLEHSSEPSEMMRSIAGLNAEFFYFEVPLDPFKIIRVMPNSWYRKYVKFMSKTLCLRTLIDLFANFWGMKLGLIPPFAVIQQHEHINYFNEKSFSNLLVKNGFEPIEISSFNYNFKWVKRVLVCLARKKTPTKNFILDSKKPDIILVNPPTRVQSRNIPFSILSLAGYLDTMGEKCEIIDIKYPQVAKLLMGGIEDYIVEKLFNSSVHVVGFTCLTAEFECVYRMAKRLREKGFKGVIVAGGHHPTFCPSDFLDGSGVFDYVVLGEGEVTLYELLKAIENKSKTDRIDGLAFYTKNGVHRTQQRQLLENLSFLSGYTYHFINLNYYLQPRLDLIRNILMRGVGVQTTRGCPFNCTFCGNNSLWSANKYTTRIRSRPPRDVVNEIVHLKKMYDIDGFSIEDDMFTLNDQRVAEFCDFLKQENLGLVWVCQSHINTFTEVMAKKIKEAGCVQVEFGVESGSERILKEIKKETSIKRIHSAFSICKKYGLRSLANFLINTPTEDETDLKATLSLADEIKATKYSFGVTVPLLGTELYDKYVHPRLKKDEYKIDGERRAYQEIVDPRFHLANHNRNIGWLYIYVRLKYMIIGEYFDSLFWFISNYKFYKNSNRFRLYLYELVGGFFRKLCKFLKQVEERILMKLKP